MVCIINWIKITYPRFIRPPYPGLHYRIEKNNGTWEGALAFTGRYDSIRIKDCFEICIELPRNSHIFPLVKEVGGRIEKIIVDRKLRDKKDLHVNPNGTICLCPRPQEKRIFPSGINLREFINKLVIPYFFQLSYFEKNGKWLWGQYSHGEAGIMEYYLDHRNDNDPGLLDDCLIIVGRLVQSYYQPNGRERCICKSGIKFKRCHPKALSGFKAMIEDSKLRQKA